MYLHPTSKFKSFNMMYTCTWSIKGLKSIRHAIGAVQL